MVSKEELLKALEEKKEKNANDKELLVRSVNEYRAATFELFTNIERWLYEFKQSGVTVERIPCNLTDALGEASHTYNIERMHVSLGNKKFTIEPVTRFVIGAKGLLEVRVGSEQKERLVISADAANAGAWLITRYDERRPQAYKPLTEEDINDLVAKHLL